MRNVQLSWKQYNQSFKEGNIRDNCQIYIFRGIIATKSNEKLRTCDKHIRYTGVRESVTEGLENIWAATKSLSLHSLWAGGVTAAGNMGEHGSMEKNMEDGSQKKLKMDTFTKASEWN